MGQAIGDMLPAAVGVAISPIGIIPVVLMLVSARGRMNGPAFLVGWFLGVAAAGMAILFLVGRAGASDDSEPAGWVSWLKLVLGALVLVLALKQWRGRPRGEEEPVTPKWMGALDSFTPLEAAGAGVVLAALNPKNLLLIASGMVAVAESGIPAGEQAAALVVFALIASLGVAIPVALYFALGDQSQELLDRLKGWMVHYGQVIMAVILLVIGAKLIGDAISGFSS